MRLVSTRELKAQYDALQTSLKAKEKINQLQKNKVCFTIPPIPLKPSINYVFFNIIASRTDKQKDGNRETHTRLRRRNTKHKN